MIVENFRTLVVVGNLYSCVVVLANETRVLIVSETGDLIEVETVLQLE